MAKMVVEKKTADQSGTLISSSWHADQLHSTKKDNHSIRTLHDEETKQRQERRFL